MALTKNDDEPTGRGHACPLDSCPDRTLALAQGLWPTQIGGGCSTPCGRADVNRHGRT
jgi:hypothetical protein